MNKKPLLVFLLTVALILSYGFFYLFFPVVYKREGVRFFLKPNIPAREVIAELHAQGIISHPRLFYFLVTLRNSPNSLKAGEYLFRRGSSPHSIWFQMVRGKGFYYYRYTIIPGWTFAHMRTVLNQAEAMNHTTQNDTDAQIMALLGAPKVAPEGEFFPDTYYYTYGTADIVVLKKAYQLMQTKLSSAWAERAENLPLTDPYQALTAASLIEKEAYLALERPIIAGVLINRLNKDMRLQFDPTVIYGIGARYDGKIHSKDLKDNNPYNTYVHKGLPPTPIAMPSYASLEAVLHPSVHNYYYFVAKGDGSHQFSESLIEHNKAVKQAVSLRAGFFNTVLLENYLRQRL